MAAAVQFMDWCSYSYMTMQNGILLIDPFADDKELASNIYIYIYIYSD